MSNKDELKAANQAFGELSDDALAEVTGGGKTAKDVDEENLLGNLAVGMAVNLVGTYYADSYAEQGASRNAIGWTGLSIGAISAGRKAPYRIDHNGQPIGWAPASSIQKFLI